MQNIENNNQKNEEEEQPKSESLKYSDLSPYEQEKLDKKYKVDSKKWSGSELEEKTNNIILDIDNVDYDYLNEHNDKNSEFLYKLQKLENNADAEYQELYTERSNLIRNDKKSSEEDKKILETIKRLLDAKDKLHKYIEDFETPTDNVERIALERKKDLDKKNSEREILELLNSNINNVDKIYNNLGNYPGMTKDDILSYIINNIEPIIIRDDLINNKIPYKPGMEVVDAFCKTGKAGFILGNIERFSDTLDDNEVIEKILKSSSDGSAGTFLFNNINKYNNLSPQIAETLRKDGFGQDVDRYKDKFLDSDRKSL